MRFSAPVPLIFLPTPRPLGLGRPSLAAPTICVARRRSATLRYAYGSAPRTAAITAQEGAARYQIPKELGASA